MEAFRFLLGGILVIFSDTLRQTGFGARGAATLQALRKRFQTKRPAERSLSFFEDPM